jgi:hypothetical protein
MRWNKRTAQLGLLILLPVVILAIYLAVRNPSATVHQQIVTPVAVRQASATTKSKGRADAQPETKPPETKTAPSQAEDPAPAPLEPKDPPQPSPITTTKANDAVAAVPSPELKSLPPPADLTPSVSVPPPVSSPVVSAPSSPDMNITKVAGSAELSPPSPPRLVLAGSPSLPATAQPGNVNTEVKCPWTLRLEVVKGRTILTAETGKDASFRVDCERLELKAPQGSIQAVGGVKISSNGLEGTSDRLTVNLQEDQVILEGRAALVSRRHGENMEIKGERLSVRLVKTGGDPDDKPTVKK